MRKLLFTLIGVLTVVSITFTIYTRFYKIADDKDHLEANIMKFLNRNNVNNKYIEVKKELNLDNKKYIMIMADDMLGDAELTKGLNNKYKIECVGYGTGYLRNGIYKTKSRKYLILEGKNLDNKIAYTKVFLDNNEYKINIPQEEYFMSYCEVPIETQNTNIDSNNIKFYDSNNVDITKEVFKALL